jgi:hypothetical protein
MSSHAVWSCVLASGFREVMATCVWTSTKLRHESDRMVARGWLALCPGKQGRCASAGSDGARGSRAKSSQWKPPACRCLIEFGRHAAADREQRGLGKPETFNFLGFTFICSKSRKGRFLIRKARRDRMMAKLLELKEEMRRRMHWPISEQG